LFADIGTFEIFVKPDSKGDDIDGLAPRFNLSADMGDTWFPGNFTVPQQSEPFQVRASFLWPVYTVRLQ